MPLDLQSSALKAQPTAGLAHPDLIAAALLPPAPLMPLLRT